MRRTKKEITRRLIKSYITAKGDRVPRKQKKRALKNINVYVVKATFKCDPVTLDAVGLGIDFCLSIFDMFSGISKTQAAGRMIRDTTHHCEHCGREMKPCPGKLHANGERSYVGYFPCACKYPIMTDMGVVDPGTEDHDYLMKSGNYSINDLLTPVK